MVNIAFLAVSSIAVVILLVAAIWAFQEQIAFQPPRPPFPDPGLTKRVDYRARDGQSLFAYVVGDAHQSCGLLIAFHGNADLAIRQVDWAHEVTERTGWSVMVPEFRGYMGLRGNPVMSRLGSMQRQPILSPGTHSEFRPIESRSSDIPWAAQLQPNLRPVISQPHYCSSRPLPRLKRWRGLLAGEYSTSSGLRFHVCILTLSPLWRD